MAICSARSSSCLILLFIVLAISAASAQRIQARLEGVVTDGAKPVIGTLAVMNDYESVWQVKTDAAGEFSFIMPTGCYDVLISSPLFHPSVKRICVKSGDVKKLSIKLKRESAPKFPPS